MKRQKIKLCFVFLFLSLSSFGQMSLSKEAIYVGEPLFVTVTFIGMKNIPEHKLIVNGNDILSSDPMAGFFIENAVNVNQGGKETLCYTIALLLDEKGGFLFKDAGDYIITLDISGKKTEKKLLVKGVPAGEKDAFCDYEKLANILPIFLLGELKIEAFSKAEEMVKKHPKSIYSKLPALYYVSMSDRTAKQQIISSEKLEVGDKVDIAAFNKKRIAIHDANAKILSSFDFSRDGMLNEKAELVLLQNRLANISAMNKVPPQEEILDLSKRLAYSPEKYTQDPYQGSQGNEVNGI